MNTGNKKVNESNQTLHTHFKRCPICNCSTLLKFDDDYFCDHCDWNSVLFDVYSGNFERRIGMLTRNRRAMKSFNELESGLLLLEDLEGSASKSNHSLESGVIYETDSEHDLNKDDFNGGAA